MILPLPLPSDRWRDGESCIEILPPPDFNYRECLAFMARSGLECLHQVRGAELYKLLEISGERVVIRVSCPSQVLRVEFPLQTPEATTRKGIADYLWELFDLGRDLSLFYQLAEQDDLLREVVQKYRGLRIVGMPDLFEVLTWAIIGQQINLAFAYTLKRRFVERFGISLPYKDSTFWLYPAPEAIAGINITELTGLQFTGKKAEYVIGIAKAMAEGELSKAVLRQTDSFEEVRSRLIGLKGVGDWTADYVLMKCFRQTSACPVADVGLHNAIKKQLGLAVKPTLAEVREMSRAWSGWEAYATFYLWRSLYE